MSEPENIGLIGPVVMSQRAFLLFSSFALPFPHELADDKKG
jgi:hypothetical protein